MKKPKPLGVLFAVIVVVIGLAMYVTIKVNAQNQYTSDLAERLERRGVPVKHVAILKRIPYEIEIVLQSSSSDDHLSLEDNWFMQLARREAVLAYRVGTGLDSFKLIVLNVKSEVIYSTQTYLYPEDLSQQLIPPEQLKVDNATTKEIIMHQLQLAGLSLDSLDISSEDVDGFSGQVLMVQVSSENLDTANQSMPKFLGSFFKMLDTINGEHQTYIVLCRLRLLDQKGNVLLDYVKDLESGFVQWTSVEGLYDEWHPKPKATDNGMSPIPTPAPIFTSPVPVPIAPQ